jgi:hypothetical protein
VIKWGDYNYDYDEKSRRTDFHPNRYRFLKLQINEGDKSAEYTLKFNSTKRGLWIGSEPPRVSFYHCMCNALLLLLAKKFYHENPINFFVLSLSLSRADTIAGKHHEEASTSQSF